MVDWTTAFYYGVQMCYTKAKAKYITIKLKIFIQLGI